MQIVRFGEKLNTPLTLALGYFETMHLGHKALIDTAKQAASKNGSKVGLFTFDRKGATEVYSFDERMDLYRESGIDYVIVATFDKTFASTKGADFLRKLNDLFCLKALVCGFDYTFGNDRLDNFDLTVLLDGKLPLYVVKPVMTDGEKVSSTLVRSLLNDNKIERVNSLLASPYFIEGAVAHGRGVGSQIGFPTANISVDAGKLLPHGVFGGYVETASGSYPAIVNIGDKPTFDIAEQTVEAYLVGFDGNLYGQKVKITLTCFIRPIRKFVDAQELAEQLACDVKCVTKEKKQ